MLVLSTPGADLDLELALDMLAGSLLDRVLFGDVSPEIIPDVAERLVDAALRGMATRDT